MIKVLISKNRVVSHYISYKLGGKPFFLLPTITVLKGWSNERKYIYICLFLFTKELRTIIYLSKL